MKNNLWVFGCSYSSGYLVVPREKAYCNLIAEELYLNPINLANPGNSNDIMIYNLTTNLNNIKDNDIVLFQFSNFKRIGFFNDNNNTFSTAGLDVFGVKHKKKEYPLNDYSEKDLNVLLEYILFWQDKRFNFDYRNVINILEFLEKTKNVKYITLFMNDEKLIYQKNVIYLPLENNKNNVSLHDFFLQKKLTIGDEFPEKYDYFDTHPGFNGHIEIKKLIIKKLIDG